MSTRYRADEYADIAKHLKDIEAEKTARINGISLEDAKPVEAPADIDFTGMYGYVTSVAPIVEAPADIDWTGFHGFHGLPAPNPSEWKTEWVKITGKTIGG